MSVAEVKTSIAQLSVEERLDVAAFITHLNQEQDPEFMAELGERMDQMRAGRETTQEQLEALHRHLTSEGR